MPRILEKEARITHVITLSVDKARAIEDPIRAAMLDLLSEKPMSVEEIVRELRRFGRRYSKAHTTIRHHLDILRRAGLIELVRVEEAGGAVLKYYAAKAKFYGYEIPQEFEEKFREVVEFSSGRISKLIGELLSRYGGLIKEVASGLKPCPYCSLKHFEEYVILEILQRAIADAINRRAVV